MIKVRVSAITTRPGLAEMLAYAARKSGWSEFDVAVVLTWCLQGLAAEVAKGNTVTLPGFGKWAPYNHKPKRRALKGLPPVCIPRFYPAMGFKDEVASSVVPKESTNKEILSYIRKHTNPVRRPISRERTFTALDSFRSDLMAQARANFVELTANAHAPATD